MEDTSITYSWATASLSSLCPSPIWICSYSFVCYPYCSWENQVNLTPEYSETLRNILNSWRTGEILSRLSLNFPVLASPSLHNTDFLPEKSLDLREQLNCYSSWQNTLLPVISLRGKKKAAQVLCQRRISAHSSSLVVQAKRSPQECCRGSTWAKQILSRTAFGYMHSISGRQHSGLTIAGNQEKQMQLYSPKCHSILEGDITILAILTFLCPS